RAVRGVVHALLGAALDHIGPAPDLELVVEEAGLARAVADEAGALGRVRQPVGTDRREGHDGTIRTDAALPEISLAVLHGELFSAGNLVIKVDQEARRTDEGILE